MILSLKAQLNFGLFFGSLDLRSKHTPVISSSWRTRGCFFSDQGLEISIETARFAREPPIPIRTGNHQPHPAAPCPLRLPAPLYVSQFCRPLFRVRQGDGTGLWLVSLEAPENHETAEIATTNTRTPRLKPSQSRAPSKSIFFMFRLKSTLILPLGSLYLR